MIAPEIYGWWLYDKTEIARFRSENGRFYYWNSNPTHRPYIEQLDNYKRDNFAAVGVVGGNSNNVGRGSYAGDTYENSANNFNPTMYHKGGFASDSQILYQEASVAINSFYTTYPELQYGMQIWLGKSLSLIHISEPTRPY